MEIILKTTDKGYSVTQDNNQYFLNLGQIKKGEEQKVILRFSDVNAKTFLLESTCGCTTTDKKIISPKEVEYKVIYNGNTSLPKTLVILNNNKQTELKLNGKII